ncbi:hypothetical protein AB3N59_12225 [Leptospira sp. WS92.C1]
MKKKRIGSLFIFTVMIISPFLDLFSKGPFEPFPDRKCRIFDEREITNSIKVFGRYITCGGLNEDGRASKQWDGKLYIRFHKYNGLREGNHSIEVEPGEAITKDPVTLKSLVQDRTRQFSFYDGGTMTFWITTSDSDKLDRTMLKRNFLLLPYRKKRDPDFVQTSEDFVDLLLPSGEKARFSTVTSDLISIEGLEVELSPLEHIDIMARTNGGIKIKPQSGRILFDQPHPRGTFKTAVKMKWNSFLTDSYNNRCTIKNSDFYEADKTDEWEWKLKYTDNSSLSDFLKKKCPMLKIPEPFTVEEVIHKSN